MGKILEYIKSPGLIVSYLARNYGAFKWMKDDTYLKILYKAIYHKKLNLHDPKTFSEKLQWLKLYDRNEDYVAMVDKYQSKIYVAGLIGEEHIIPTLGVWDSFDDIDFKNLPRSYVLKCTHDSGGLVICRNNNIDFKAAKEKINSSLKRNYYYLFREWPYKEVKPRIIAEKYMENNGEPLVDYKFYCFNGEPRFLYVSKGLENHKTARISFLNIDWTFADFQRTDYKGFEKLPEKPKHYDQMIEFARRLSRGIRFLRVDLYEIDGTVYFSELTFSPNSGFMVFTDMKYDREIGDLLEL